MLKVALSHRFAFGDRLVEQRLRETRFIAFIVAEAAVRVEIDDRIPLEFHPEVQRKLDYLSDRFGIFAVHVEDRDLQRTPNIRRINGRPALFGPGSEPDLIVNNDVERAAD